MSINTLFSISELKFCFDSVKKKSSSILHDIRPSTFINLPENKIQNHQTTFIRYGHIMHSIHSGDESL